MNTRNFNISMEDGNFDHAEAILSDMGLELTTYLKMAIVKLIKEKCIPFELSSNPVLFEPQQSSAIPSTSANLVDFNRSAVRETNKITNEMCNALWEEFKRRRSSGNTNLQEAAQLISVQTGMNRGSAFIYFNILNNLMDGMKNTRALKYADLVFFVGKIRAELPEQALKATITSLEASIPYWHEKLPSSFADKVRRFVDELLLLLQDWER